MKIVFLNKIAFYTKITEIAKIAEKYTYFDEKGMSMVNKTIILDSAHSSMQYRSI